jgi:catechol 2,3-dioxygenase-like lactoylglutathione lyase family enzyme
MDMKLELISVPVSDVDRAKTFYTDKAGFNADHDHNVSDDLRFVQLTPPGSACSISIGKGLSSKAERAGRGVDVSEISDYPWGRFVFFSDPDGNGWAVQEIPART